MNKYKYELSAISIALFVAMIAYLTSSSFIIAGAVLLIYIVYYFALARKKIKKYLELSERIDCCHHFISAFLITLSVKESLNDAFESGTRNANESFTSYLSQMEEMNIDEQIDYLQKYFKLNVYSMFVNVVRIYEEQGGNVLKVADSLLAENSRIEQMLNDMKILSRKKTVEFAILWILAFVVLAFMRFALSSFYEQMLQSMIFIILLVAFFLLFILSVHFYIARYTKLPIKEEELINE